MFLSIDLCHGNPQQAYGAKSNVCGRIWGKGYVAYRCRTCGMSPCSAICHECFEKVCNPGTYTTCWVFDLHPSQLLVSVMQGPHRTHNFLMYRSVAGGCCDCGDPGAWKSSGFCTNHKVKTETLHHQTSSPQLPHHEGENLEAVAELYRS
jgi:hypothetical protein